jgi:hypothetical protein
MNLPIKGKEPTGQSFGLSLDTKLNLVGLITLILSLIGGVPQLYRWITSGDVEILAPAQIELFSSGKAYSSPLGIHADMTYVSNALPESRSLIIGENASFSFSHHNQASRQIELQWAGYVKTVPDQEGRLSPRRAEDARPFMIRGGESVGHETQFLPRYTPCEKEGCDKEANLLPWKAFVQGVRAQVANNEKTKISFELMSTIAGKKLPLKTSCALLFDGVDVVAMEKDGIITRTCVR